MLAKQQIIESRRSDGPEARIVRAIQSVGPRNVRQIARMTGVPVETVRYKIKHQLGRLGFHIHAEPNLWKLGLVPHWARLTFENGCSDELSVSILRKLSENGYLTYFGRLVPRGDYMALFTLPLNTSYDDILSQLKSARLLRDYSIVEVVSSRYLSMNPSYFDFYRGVWAVDWERLSRDSPSSEPLQERIDPVNPDMQDLLIIKELQKDAMQRIAEIGSKLKLSSPMLRWHMQKHVSELGLISNYSVRWMGDIESTRQHSLLLTWFEIKEIGNKDVRKVSECISRLPFAWSEYFYKNGGYSAVLCIPVEEAISTFGWIRRQLGPINSEISFFERNGGTESYTIPYQMYSGERGWIFEPRKIEEKMFN
jgi:DNA-binding Lrp family transcriptional regulator